MTKPGIQTTEFWVHNVLQIVTLITGLLQAVKPEAALWVSTALAGLYIFARAIAKFGDAMATPPDVPAAPAQGGSITMGSVWLLLGVLLLAGGVGLSGCAQTETNRVAQTVVSTKMQADLALDLHNAGLTTPSQEATIGLLLQAEAKAEDAYYAAIAAGDSAAMKAAKASWAAATSAAASELAKYPSPPKPTTARGAVPATLPNP